MKRIELLTLLKIQNGFGRSMAVFCEDPMGLAHQVVIGSKEVSTKRLISPVIAEIELNNHSRVFFFKKGLSETCLCGYRFNTILVEGDYLSKKEQEIILPRLGVCHDPVLFEKYDIPKDWGIKQYPELIFSGEGEMQQKKR